jgi:hypothetical protein
VPPPAHRYGGLFELSPPVLSVVHLVGLRCFWCEGGLDIDGGGKFEVMQHGGMWAADAYSFRQATTTAIGWSIGSTLTPSDRPPPPPP